MWKHLGILPRRMVLAMLLAGSLATAAFAFNATVHAKQIGCCLLIAHCIGNTCEGNGECGGGYCCIGMCE
jgi:hypothetical protein